MPEVRREDRVLVLSLDDMDAVRRWSDAGALIGLGSLEQVRQARREFAAMDNAMFVEGTRDQIPWMEQWFTVIVDGSGLPPTLEMQRVLAEGGRIVTSS